MSKKWKNLIRRIITLPGVSHFTYATVIFYYLVKNNWPFRIRQKITPWVCPIINFDVPSRIEYAYEVWNDYLKYGELSEYTIKGKQILEIGTGENLGVALYFWAYGATRVDCIDAFNSLLKKGQQLAIYQVLVNSLPRDKQKHFKEIMGYDTQSGFKKDTINYYNLPAEAIDEKLKSKYDLIVSRAVLEHVVNLPRAIKAMDRVLQPGGKMIHEVDFRDHGMFTRLGFPGLTFLKPPQYIWPRMTDRIGAPNRCLINKYIDLLTELNYKFKIKVNLLLGQIDKIEPIKFEFNMAIREDQLDMIESVRGQLLKEYRELPSSVLATAVAMIVAEKPLN